MMIFICKECGGTEIVEERDGCWCNSCDCYYDWWEAVDLMWHFHFDDVTEADIRKYCREYLTCCLEGE